MFTEHAHKFSSVRDVLVHKAATTTRSLECTALFFISKHAAMIGHERRRRKNLMGFFPDTDSIMFGRHADMCNEDFFSKQKKNQMFVMKYIFSLATGEANVQQRD